MADLDNLEELNRYAWAAGKPFIQDSHGNVMQTVAPEIFREQRIMAKLLADLRRVGDEDGR